MGKQKSLVKRKVEEDRVLAIYHEGAMFAISNVDFDRYQMIDLHQDAYVEGAINVGLGGLEAYDLRDLSQPRGVSDYDYDREFEESSSSGNGESDSDDSVDLDFDVVDVQEGDGVEEFSESLVDSDENGSNDGSDVDEIENVDVGDEIPRHIDAEGEDDDGNPIENVWNKILQKNKMASHPWVAQQLVIDFKANPTMQAANIQKLIMERYGVSVPRHTCNRAKKLLKSWGLVKALPNIFPECKRRICDVHYYRNFSTEYPGFTQT
ncbi:hypothetical protein Cgig2_024181 [Carnegiea gigantea]|uniref:Transposase n=1 Tax=Carnegiea gigantea TaxID=171969 RepID=A0A9Q1K9W3_9CARY|nr:hypothetical protein Cgig2_024181 [Carnegiea gigantea]